MKEQSLVDLFELYDQAFDEVCDELQVVDKPTWQHRWFYRFYQINLVPKLIYILENTNKDNELPELLVRLSKHDVYEDLLEATEKFYCSSDQTFVKWWFTKAKNYFVNSKDKVKGIMTIKFNDEFRSQDTVFWLKKFYILIKDILQQKYRADHLLIAVPVRGSKKETMELIERYIDGSFSFNSLWSGKKNQNENPYEITKNKIPLKTIKDCYRLLEYIAFNPKEDLVDIAKNSGILEFSLLNLDGDRGIESLNSIRSGTSRLMTLTIELLQGSAYGFFPAPSKMPQKSYRKDPFNEVRKIFPYLTSQQLFESARKNLPPLAKMRAQIKKEMLDLRKRNLLN